MSLTAQRKLGEASQSVSSASERLSSGQRINRASDDAAGLAIASTLNTQSRVFSQGLRNLNDGVSFYSVAEGALKEIKGILMRGKELATQAANGTYSLVQRTALDNELQALVGEYNRVIEGTSYNGRNIFATSNGALVIQAGYGEGGILSTTLQSARSASLTDIRRTNVTVNGTQTGWGQETSVSGDGRYVVVRSAARLDSTGTLGGGLQVFLRDQTTGSITLATVSNTGARASGGTYNPGVSSDGRYVIFSALAANLVTGDTNASEDVFVRDMWSGTTTRVSVATDGSQATGGDSGIPFISSDGRYVAFISDATNLVLDDTNGQMDVFVRDLIAGTTSRVSVSSNGAEAHGSSMISAISGNGRYVVFSSDASDLVTGDNNNLTDVFVRDLVAGTTTRISVDDAGTEANAACIAEGVSSDGRYVAFSTTATNFAGGATNGQSQIYVRDTWTGTTRLVSADPLTGAQGDSLSYGATLSADGRYMAFMSAAANLVSGDTNGAYDVFVRDLTSGAIACVGMDRLGGQANDHSLAATISADGRYISFQSDATNLVSGDTNNARDTFLAFNSLFTTSQVSHLQWVSVKTQTLAKQAMDWLESYLDEVNTTLGVLGASMSRFETAKNNLFGITENSKAAEGRIRDADVAAESSQLIRSQMLQQIGASVLAQANQLPSLALQLLR